MPEAPSSSPVPDPRTQSEPSKHGYWGPLPGESPELYKALGAPWMERVILERVPEPFRGNFSMAMGRDPGKDVRQEALPPNAPTRRERLERFVEFTKRNEFIHTAAFILGSAAAVYTAVEGEEGWKTVVGVSALSILSVVPNIPPIIIQRYNRLRAYRLLDGLSVSSRTAATEDE